MFKLNKHSILITIAVLGIIVTGVLIFTNLSFDNFTSFFKLNFGYSVESVAKKSVDYLNSNVLQKGQTAALVSFSEESGVVKINIKIGNNSYDSYATRDGKLLFPEALTMDSKVSQQAGQDNSVDISKIKIDGNPFIGDKNAPVVIAEWFDYQCPFCKKIEQEVMPQLINEYVKTGRVKVVFKDYQFLGADSQTAGLAARAVWEISPGKFGEWYKAIFEKQDSENSGWGNKADILVLTKSLGIDSVKVGQLMTSKADEYQKMINADKLEGTNFGIKGTPGFIIGKQLISGFTAYVDLKTSIDKVLSGK